MIGTDELLRLQTTAGRVFVHHAIVDYVVRLVVSTRRPAEHGMPDVASWVSYGASPRASLGLIAASRAIALLRGRDYVLPQDVLDIATDVLAHRIVLSYDAIADGVPATHAVRRVLQTVPLPQVSPRQRAGGPPEVTQGAAPSQQPLVYGTNAPQQNPVGRAFRMSRMSAGRHRPRPAARPERRPNRCCAGSSSTVRNRLDGLLQGNYLGLVPGPGSEAGESRLYLPGDDVRRMDWPVTARTTTPHVRQTIADRELETWLVVDLSPSMDFGTALTEKRELVLAAHHRDRPPDGARRQPGRRDRQQRRGRVPRTRARRTQPRALPDPPGRPDPPRRVGRRTAGSADLLESLRRPPRRRGLVAVVSDFLDAHRPGRPRRPGSARCAPCRRGTSCSASRCSTRANSNCRPPG